MIKVDKDNLDVSSGGGGVGLEQADPVSLSWEARLVEEVLSLGGKVNAARSFEDLSLEAIFFDVRLMAFGYILMFIYAAIMIGRANNISETTSLILFH